MAESDKRFAWSDGDVAMYDKEGNRLTARQAKEMALERLRSEVEEDPAEEAEQTGDRS